MALNPGHWGFYRFLFWWFRFKKRTKIVHVTQFDRNNLIFWLAKNTFCSISVSCSLNTIHNHFILLFLIFWIFSAYQQVTRPWIILFWWKCCRLIENFSNTHNHFSCFFNFQCILTRADHQLFYSGENTGGIVQPQSLTCPFCRCLGFTETSLVDHVSSAHLDLFIHV